MLTAEPLDAVVISDLHLGSHVCRAKALHAFLDELPPTKRLVLNGDVLESTETRLRRHHWGVLSRLRRLSDDVELVWVRGNHDGDSEVLAHLIGAAYVDELSFPSGDVVVGCVHGDKWDDFVTNRPVLTFIADLGYSLLQKLGRRFAAGVKRQSKTFVRCAEKVEQGVLVYAAERRWDYVVCGHTHLAYAKEKYVNSGCWTEPTCHYVAVGDGKVELKEAKP